MRADRQLTHPARVRRSPTLFPALHSLPFGVEYRMSRDGNRFKMAPPLPQIDRLILDEDGVNCIDALPQLAMKKFARIDHQ